MIDSFLGSVKQRGLPLIEEKVCDVIASLWCWNRGSQPGERKDRYKFRNLREGAILCKSFALV